MKNNTAKTIETTTTQGTPITLTYNGIGNLHAEIKGFTLLLTTKTKNGYNARFLSGEKAGQSAEIAIDHKIVDELRHEDYEEVLRCKVCNVKFRKSELQKSGMCWDCEHNL